MADKFLVIDGSSLIHRAFFALPPLTTQQGLNTGAVYGFCNMLLRLLNDVQPKWLAVAFDKSRHTFRTELYPEYKGQRKPTPSELSEQFPLARRLLESMNIAVLELDDYEADDIIGTFAVHAPQNAQLIIVTGDKDELQLIDERTQVYFTKRGITDIKAYDAQVFAADYEGLAPKQLIDLKGLMGDTSDNIPGVPGVGPKTALKLIGEYGSVENVLANAEQVAGKSLRQKLQQYQEQALLSKRLATIFTDVPLDLNLEKYQLQAMQPSTEELMRNLEFKNLYTRFSKVLGMPETQTEDFGLFGAFAEPETAPSQPREQLATAQEAQAFFAALAEHNEPTAVLLQSGGELPKLHFTQAELLANGKIYEIFAATDAWLALLAWLSAPAPKATIDIKEVYKTAACMGLAVQGFTDDPALAGYLIDPGRSSYALAELADLYLPGGHGEALSDLSALVPVLRAKLAEREQTKLYEELELPLAKMLAQMELAGIKADVRLLTELTQEMLIQITALETLAQEQAGENINLNSPKQLGVLLFEKLQLPIIKKTKTGYSTDVSVLEQLYGRHPLITTLLEYRKLSKLYSTYLEGLRPLINPVTGRIHTHYQQLVTVTGRLSSTEPNLQNIPTRTETGKRIREMFIPGDGYDLLLSCDYSQVELRVLAHICGDTLLLESFSKGQDVHQRTAAEVFGVPLESVSSAMRSRAKAVNFGIVYGISDYGLAKQLDISRAEAAKYIDNYFERYTGVKQYMEAVVAKARELGYVETLFGRRRYLPDIKHSNYNLRSFAERTAINTPIQGTAADIIKLAMLKVQAALAEHKLSSRVLLQVHDELVLETTAAQAELTARVVKEAMESAATLSVPLIAEAATGKNWAAAK